MATRRNVLIGAGAAAAAAGAAAYGYRGGPSHEEAVAEVWARREPRGHDDIAYLVHYAILAANSHNTQPWRFRRTQDGLTVLPDLTRATPVADPDHHHVFASLGCAAENLVLAARAAGGDATAGFLAEGEGGVGIELAAGSGGRDPLFDAILERQCTRSDYDGRAVPADDLRKLEAAAAVEGCRVILIPDRARIDEALELVIAANTRQVENPEFAGELKSWIRFNAAHAVRTRDGLYSACSGNPALPPLVGRAIFRFVFTAKSENERYARHIRSSSGLAVFVSDRDDKAHWVAAGRSYQRFALAATMLGIRHAFINQPVEVASMRAEFARWLGVAGMRPDLVLRYGYAPAMPKSLRRPVEAVLA